MEIRRNLLKTAGISVICLSLVGMPIAANAEDDPCGWQAGAVSAALLAGIAYLLGPGATDAAGLLTLTTGGYGALDYLKVPCPSQTEDLNQSCVDSLGGCDEDPSQTQGGDDGSES